MYLIDDINLITSLTWSELKAAPQFLDIVHTAMAGGVEFDYIQARPTLDFKTGFTIAARLGGGAFDAVERHGKNTCGGSLTRSSWSAEKVCMGNTSGLDCIRQRLGDMALADYFREGGRAIFPV